MTSNKKDKQIDHRPSPSGFHRLDLTHVLTARAMPQPMLIPNLLPASEVMMLVGEPASSKTQLSLAMACSVATGEPFLGQELAEAHPVAFFALEGSRWSLEERLRRMSAHLTTGPDSGVHALITENLHILFQSGRPDSISADPMAGISDHVEFLISTGVKLALIVIDTLSCVSFGDENSVEAARPLWAYANYVRMISGATVMLIHHLGKPMNKPGQAPRAALHAIRGSSAHHAAARFILGLTVKKKGRRAKPMGWTPPGGQEVHGDLLELKVLKANDGPEGYTMALERDMVTGTLAPYEARGPEGDQADPPTRTRMTKAEQVLRIYQDTSIDETEREVIALPLFGKCKDPGSALRSTIKRLRDDHLLA